MGKKKRKSLIAREKKAPDGCCLVCWHIHGEQKRDCVIADGSAAAEVWIAQQGVPMEKYGGGEGYLCDEHLQKQTEEME